MVEMKEVFKCPFCKIFRDANKEFVHFLDFLSKKEYYEALLGEYYEALLGEYYECSSQNPLAPEEKKEKVKI